MQALDKIAVEKMHNSNKTGGVFEYLMAIFAVTFNNEITAFVYTLGLLAMPWSPKNLFLCISLPPFCLLVTYLLKRKISRPRPDLYIPRCQALIFDFRGREKNHSMPSGDSIQAAAFWMALTYFSVVPYWLASILVGFTMLSRVYYMCHYPSDTILGAFIGVLNFYIVKSILMIP
jgi:membrane-associated phospholipid phosphatase